MTQERERQFKEARADVVEYGKETGFERLVVLDAKTGKRLDALNGLADSMVLTDSVMALINDGNNAVRLTHNHQGNLSCSLEDLVVASKPGVESIEAVGHDGSWYRAKLKRAPVDLETKIAKTHDAVMNRLGKLVSDRKIELDSAGQLFHHIANLALAKSGIMDYEYQLSATQEKTWMRLEVELNPIVQAVATQIGNPP